MSERLNAALEVAGLCRRVEAEGGFAAVIRRGDPDRGELVIEVMQKGAAFARLERRLTPNFTYAWERIPLENRDGAVAGADRARIDPDLWLIELDVADAERFIAEMTSSG